MSLGFEEMLQAIGREEGKAPAVSWEECLDAARSYAQDRRAEIRQRHQAGESGSNVVHMLAEMADTLLRGVFRFGLASLRISRPVASRLCLCALGGYGRGELSPGSDLDVCLLYEGRLEEPIRNLSGFLVPILWDVSGFPVGFATRSLKQTGQLARKDLRAFTSFLEARMLSGERGVFARMKLQVYALQQGPLGAEFVARKVRDRLEGLSEEHADLFAPEPHLKESAGGLRDFHTALWLFMMSHGVGSLDEAVARGLITAEEHLESAEALDFLWRVRNELHFHTGATEDRLIYRNQKQVASAFGYESAHQSGVLQFMQDYYAAAGRLRRFLTIAARICHYPAPADRVENGGAPRDFIVEDGQLFVAMHDEHWFAHAPARLMEVYWRCARHDVQLSRYSERRITQNLHLVTNTFRSNDLVRRFFVAICNRPTQAGRVLRQAANSGLLGQYIPEFAEVKGVLRYEDFHHYPVDEHILQSVEALNQVHRLEGPVGRCLSEALEHLSDPYLLVMAILFHDLGKVAGETHVAESVRRARRICRRIGMPEEDEEQILFLVQHHLLMNTISQFRDTDDDHILESFANTVRTEQRLRALFLLSFADLFAVGPNVWNEWKGVLLMQLYLRTVKRLLGRAETVGEEFWRSPKAERIRSLARDDLKGRVEEHLRGLGQRYFLAFSPEQIAEHLVCIAEAEQSGLALHSSQEGETGHSEVVICSRDRHGLFSVLAGAFSSQLIDVASAAVFTRPDGLIVDCFTVTDARSRRPLTRRQVNAVERVLREVLVENKDLLEYVERSRHRLFALLQPRIPVPTRIEFDNYSSRTHTVIDIETGDRTGLLYDVTRAIADAGLEITTARIVTDARRVRDSFYVHNQYAKIESPEEQEVIREQLRNAIHPRSSVEAKGGSS